ncbi:hypothetical protein M4L39_01635 [Staphylococcus equorum]|uniref:Uncharacterized protein n=1 Tax=Staphylococcus equorum TaxID=246432 RepID=A0A9X4L777_9STAP|nr:hypothetical protein [Staphylococcus equorum]MDG0842123.1 hypothetical protein [Staphylococcus equorum]MDG0857826.1 hypothetical protein [Staphylococcus equorum]
MEVLNIIAYSLLIIFILVVFCGVFLVNKGQDRSYFMLELKMLVMILFTCFIGLGITLTILGYFGKL